MLFNHNCARARIRDRRRQGGLGPNAANFSAIAAKNGRIMFCRRVLAGTRPTWRETLGRPLWSECGTKKPVKAKLWPWLEPFSVKRSVKPSKMFPPRSTAASHFLHLPDRRGRRWVLSLTSRETFVTRNHQPLQKERISFLRALELYWNPATCGTNQSN